MKPKFGGGYSYHAELNISPIHIAKKCQASGENLYRATDKHRNTPNTLSTNTNIVIHKTHYPPGLRYQTFLGAGLVDGTCDNSEGCLKWGVVGVIEEYFQRHRKQGVTWLTLPLQAFRYPHFLRRGREGGQSPQQPSLKNSCLSQNVKVA